MTDETDVDLRAIRAFERHLETVVDIWKPGREEAWIMRRWAICDDGQVVVPDFESIVLPTKRAGKDATMLLLSMWCAAHRPAGLIIASETWGYSIKDEDYQRLRREIGTTPDLMIPENREMLRRRYGLVAVEGLMVHGQLRGRKAIHRTYEIEAGRLHRRPDGVVTRSLFDGVLDGYPTGLGGV
jgi:hypothetical protein